MADQILEALRQPELLNYLRARESVAYLGEELFPSRAVDELDYKYLVGADRRPVMASVTAINAEAPIRSRLQPISVVQGQIPAIKHKRSVDAETMFKLQSPRPRTSEFEQAIAELYNDAADLREGVRATKEFLRMQALTTGQIVINDPDSGVRLTADFGVPTTQKLVCDGTGGRPAPWTDATTRDILGNIEAWTQLVEDATGVRPTRILTTRHVVNLMLRDANVRDAVWNQANSRRPITQADLAEVLDRLGLPTEIMVYDAQIRRENADGTHTTLRLLPRGIFILLPPDELGETLSATPVEALQQPDRVAVVELDQERIALTTWEEIDPPARWIRASALSFPTFPRANEVFIATVDPAA